MKCTACESSALIEGEMVTGGEFAFIPLKIPRFKRAWGIGARKVRAYACMHCQHLQFLVDFTEEDRRKHQQFEGEQPSVLERLGADSPEEESAQPKKARAKSATQSKPSKKGTKK